MGIKQLMTLISERAPGAVSQLPLESYSGKVLACNASMTIYQSILATQFGNTRGPNSFTDDSGIASAHLLGLFNKTIQFLDLGIKPIWVFDGRLPPLKATQLAEKRRVRSEHTEDIGLVYHSPGHTQSTGSEAEDPEAKTPYASLIYKQFNQKKRSNHHVRGLESAFSTRHDEIMDTNLPYSADCPDFCCIGESDEETGRDRDLHTFLEGLRKQGDAQQARQAFRVTREMTEDAMLLLTLLGVPVLVAPGEAEAQCAALVTAGRAYAVASEDVDSLVFGAKVLVRGVNLNKQPVTEISLPRVLTDLALTHRQFIDLAILLGCDYCANVNCAGPNTAYKLIKQHGTLEKVLSWIADNRKKWTIPSDFPYKAVRELFASPEVWKDMGLCWKPPDEAQLRIFFTVVKGFAPMKVDYGLRKAKKLQAKPMQKNLDTYFAAAKRNAEDSPKSVPYKRQKK